MVAKEICDANMKRIEDKVESNAKSIDGLKNIYKSINELTRAIDKLATETLHMRTEQTELKDTIKSLDNRVKHIEMKPAKKWEDLVWYVFISMVGVALLVILAKVGLK